MVVCLLMHPCKCRLDIEESVRPPSGRNITTLRIKDTDNHTYVLKMKFSDTIGDVMDYLSELRSVFYSFFVFTIHVLIFVLLLL